MTGYLLVAIGVAVMTACAVGIGYGLREFWDEWRNR